MALVARVALLRSGDLADPVVPADPLALPPSGDPADPVDRAALRLTSEDPVVRVARADPVHPTSEDPAVLADPTFGDRADPVHPTSVGPAGRGGPPPRADRRGPPTPNAILLSEVTAGNA